MKPVVLDFESEAIQPRPDYPPKPVGLAIWWPGKPPEYEAWGCPTDNGLWVLDPKLKAGVRKIAEPNRERARKKYIAAIQRGPVLFHNAKFDLDVGDTHFAPCPFPTWDNLHDTMFELFLHDPHAKELSLKPSAERLLGLKPDERDEVRDWLVAHKIIAHNENPGPHIAKAPGSLAGKYAIGDLTRTDGLHNFLQPKLDRREREAYDRERKLLSILLDNERQGMRVDMHRIEADLKTYRAAFAKCETWLRKALGVPGLNLDDDKAVGDALFKSKIVTNWTMTKGGNGRPPQRSVSKANLTLDKYNDKRVGLGLMYRNKLQVVVKNNMEPWLEQGSANKGYVFTEWNQVRQSHGPSGLKGARSGRITCSRWLNITKSYQDREDRYQHPAGLRLPELPLPRRYLLPDPGEEWNHEDYNQQEFRIVAHYEDGGLQASYRKDSRLDYHDNVRQMVAKLNSTPFDRRTIKAVNFGILYGEGVALLAAKLGMSVPDAAALKSIVKKATPGVAALDAELKRMGKSGEPIRTWGGRRYYCEPPAIAKKGPRIGEMVTFEYKLLNYLAQGSAADVTKEAIVRYHDVQKDGRMLVTVYDEINLSSPKRSGERERLRQAMESIEMDVPMLTDAKTGPNWGELEKVE